MNITLEELLLSRDNRQQTQMKLLQEYKDKTLLCLTVIMPGKENAMKILSLLQNVLWKA